MDEAEFSQAMNKLIGNKVAEFLELPEPPQLNLTYDEIAEWLDRVVASFHPGPIVFPEAKPILDTVLWRHRFGMVNWKDYPSTIAWPMV